MIGDDQLILAYELIDANQRDLAGVKIGFFLDFTGDALLRCFIAFHETGNQRKTPFSPSSIACQQHPAIDLDQSCQHRQRIIPVGPMPFGTTQPQLIGFAFVSAHHQRCSADRAELEVAHRVQTLLPTQAATPCNACGKPLGSVPPACAMSGRPPPLPPTCWATKLTSSPALTLEVASAVTPAIRLTLPSVTLASTMAAVFSLSLSLSMVSRKVATSAPSRVAASTLMPLTSTAFVTSSSPCPAASFDFSAASSFSSALTWSCTWPMRVVNSSGLVLRAPAASCRRRLSDCTSASAPSPVTASRRRMPAATPPSVMILKRPISPVRPTWTPPHSSLEEPMSSTRTSSPYFSPNSAMAPCLTASSNDMCCALVSWFCRISRLTMASTWAICSAVTGALWLKSKRVLSASTSEPFCATWLPSTSRKALCIRWVAEWLRMVRPRLSSSTRASTWSPTLSEPSASTPWWPNTSAWIFRVSSTWNRPPAPRSTPWSPTWPPDSA